MTRVAETERPWVRWWCRGAAGCKAPPCSKPFPDAAAVKSNSITNNSAIISIIISISTRIMLQSQATSACIYVHSLAEVVANDISSWSTPLSPPWQHRDQNRIILRLQFQRWRTNRPTLSNRTFVTLLLAALLHCYTVTLLHFVTLLLAAITGNLQNWNWCEKELNNGDMSNI